MARKLKTIEPVECAARQRALDLQRRRIEKAREEARREGEIAAALREAKLRRERREASVGNSHGPDTRTTRRFYADLQEIVKLPCGAPPDPSLLANLARYRRDWLRPLSAWVASGDTQMEQQSSLLRHLLIRYPVPAFMEKAWFMADLSEGREYRRWFLRMARGENIRSCSPPLRLTHRAAHLFLQAPPDCTIIGAMRRAQYLALGGGARRAAELLDTVLGYGQPNEPFWETALQFLVNHESELQAVQIAALVAYLHARVSERAPRTRPGEAPTPAFSLKGRTLGSLVRDAEAYRAAHPVRTGPVTWWKRTGVDEWQSTEDVGESRERNWSIIELLNSGELRQEGETMRHCVAFYDRHCIGGVTSIWSVRCRESETACEVPIMTIEVRNSGREIVQARGKCNQSAMAEGAGPLLRSAARQVIAWADRERLAISWGLLGWHRGQLISDKEGK